MKVSVEKREQPKLSTGFVWIVCPKCHRVYEEHLVNGQPTLWKGNWPCCGPKESIDNSKISCDDF